MKRMNKSPTGCKPAQLFGVWAITEGPLCEMVKTVKGLDLARLALENKARAGMDPTGPMPSQRPDVGSNDEYYDTDDQGVAHIDVSGPLTKYQTSFDALFGGTSYAMLRRALSLANADPDISAIMLCIDSPGGTVSGCADFAQEVAASPKPVHAYIEDMGCSAAYWIASQCQSITANSTATVGSIGVAMIVQDTSGQYAKDGVKVYRVATGPFKAAGADGTPVSDEMLAEFQRECEAVNKCFTGEVMAGRGMTADQVSKISDGRVFIGQEAKTLGLVDSIASFADAHAAIIQETQIMNLEEFNSYAAAHPDHLAIAAKTIVATAEQTGAATATTNERNRVAALAIAYKDRPAFALDMAVKGHDLPTAKAELADVVLKENTDLKAKLTKAEAGGTDHPGVRGVGGRAGADPKAEFKAAVDAKMAAKPGITRDKAVSLVNRENPELREAVVAAANA